MIAFLRWLRDIALGALNGVVRLAVFIVVLAVALDQSDHDQDGGQNDDEYRQPDNAI